MSSITLTRWGRKLVEPVLRPVALGLGRIGIRPNHLTILAFLCGITAVYFFLHQWNYFVILAIAHVLFDVMDGALARAVGTVTERGRLLDFWSDRIIEILIIAKCTWIVFSRPVTSDGTLVIGVLAILFVFITSLWHFVSKKDLPVVFSRSVILILGMLKLSWLIIPVALVLSITSLVWQIWYSLNNI